LLRARTVRPTVAFIVREGGGRTELRYYRLRENGLSVAIRHGSGDAVTLGEVFHEHDYRPTGDVEHALRNVKRILDLGANVGLFGAFAAARWPEAEILAFEPDPDNAAVHERTIAANGLEVRWKLVRAAAGAHDGVAAFAAGHVALSHLLERTNRESAGDIKVHIKDVVPQLERTDLLKMDIEGGEWAILGDRRFREAPPRVIVLEYHPHMCPESDPHSAAVAALMAADLQTQLIWRRDDGYGMLWAWRA
jgi:FkbM family methyltransferase